MESQRAVLLMVILLFLFLTPDTTQPTPAQRRELKNYIEEEWDALRITNTSKWGDLDAANGQWLNMTGMRQSDNFTWEALPAVQQIARDQFSAVFPRSGMALLNGENHSTEGVEGVNEGLPSNETTIQHATRHIPLYQNVTGVVRGKWVRSESLGMPQRKQVNLTKIVPEASYATLEYDRNITGTEGDIRIWLDEKEVERSPSLPKSAREIRAEMIIQDDSSSGDGWVFMLHGVHYTDYGGILLTTSSEKLAGIFALPHFALSEHAFKLSQQLLKNTLAEAVEKQGRDLAGGFPWSSSVGSASDALFPTPHCEYIAYLQQHPLASSDGLGLEDPLVVQKIENELRFPKGASLPSAPQMVISGTFFSPDCGFVLQTKGPPQFSPAESTHLSGLKTESLFGRGRNLVFAIACTFALQIFFLMRQMRDASTPSMRSRISFFSIGMMCLGDGFAFLTLLTASIFMPSVSLPLIGTCFLAFFSVSFLGMKFLMDIYIIQAPERRERERQSAAAARNTTNQANPASAVSLSTAAADTLPAPATARRPADAGATPVILPPDQDIETAAAEDEAAARPRPAVRESNPANDFGSIFARFYFLLILVTFVSIWASSWPETLRSAYINVLAFTYLSFWVPQIYRNAMRNCRKALRWEYIVGQSICRLVPFAYTYVFSGNILFVKTDRTAIMILAAWVWAQACLLVSQEVLGPRFLVPEGYAPPAYDYHPLLREDDLESGASMPLGFTQSAAEPDQMVSTSAGESKEKGKKTFDCAICMQTIEVPMLPPASAGESSSLNPSNLLARRAYMVTPCRHVFHSPCLEGWMRFRLQCPICREALPPL